METIKEDKTNIVIPLETVSGAEIYRTGIHLPTKGVKDLNFIINSHP